MRPEMPTHAILRTVREERTIVRDLSNGKGTMVTLALATLWLLAGSAAIAGETTPDMGQVRIIKEDFRGWPNTYRLSNGIVEARVATDVGPRIIDFRLAGGENVLYLASRRSAAKENRIGCFAVLGACGSRPRSRRRPVGPGSDQEKYSNILTK
jgi:hypothetical protein